ncbi:MAG: rhodanese-like domain-containing protein [Flavobacteriaceae bacterium]
MKYSFFLLIALSVNLSCSQIKSKPITEFSQKDAKNVLLIDVRTPGEYAKGHMDNALNINWFDANFTDRFKDFDKEKPIYLYCQKGGRSAKAAKVLDSLGYEVVNLSGGYGALITAGLK